MSRLNLNVRALLFGMIAVMGLGACQSEEEWRTLSNDVNDLTCERMYECYSETTLRGLSLLLPQLGSSADECADNFRDRNEDADLPCQPPEQFDAEAAKECIRIMDEATCDEFKEFGMAGPEVCQNICR